MGKNESTPREDRFDAALGAINDRLNKLEGVKSVTVDAIETIGLAVKELAKRLSDSTERQDNAANWLRIHGVRLVQLEDNLKRVVTAVRRLSEGRTCLDLPKPEDL